MEGIEEEVPFIADFMTGEVAGSDSFNCSGGETFSIVSVPIQVVGSWT